MPQSDGLSLVVVEDARPSENGLSYCYLIKTENRFRFLEEIHREGPFDPHRLMFENFLEKCLHFGIINSYTSSQMLVNSSQASYLLLRDQMQKFVMAEWEAFRNAIFDEYELTHTSLECFYCGAPHLVREISDPCNKVLLRTLATIDHKIALANGGKKWDKTNCVIACFPCNNQKKDRTNYVQTHKRN